MAVSFMKPYLSLVKFCPSLFFNKIACNKVRLCILNKKIGISRLSKRLSNIVIHNKKAGI